MTKVNGTHHELTLETVNLLHAKPSRFEERLTWSIIGVLLLACLITLPFSTHQWPATNMLFAAAGVASLAEITTGALLLSQAMPLRHYAGLALGFGYEPGGRRFESFRARHIEQRLSV
ncbi:hypothetical protein BJI67_15955 (plasmid) [Acidihalobacter aeolianus]|uniref:Uncharacterized protein n=1 Tax=Acidihalobacter aeolianus TaxID=2792603 RepID=A0A1D8KCP9_9GAMM|nr:hypothetical protein [Acidihalobacter aeolianus]AOV18736.1 hypothetical protein BJI67_15955 [Acidihalobacter aeolianus]